jgi:hypothetical protein
MAEERDHLPLASADRKLVAVHHAPVKARDFGHAAPIAVAGAHLLRKAREVESIAPEEAHAGFAVESRRVVMCRVRRQELRGGHPHRRARFRHEPRGASHVIGVIVRDDDGLHGLAGHQAREVPLPEIPGRLDAESRVDEREALAILEDPQVDVVEGERQRHADPPHALGDAQRLAGLGDALVEGMSYLVVKTHTPFHAAPGGLLRKCSMRLRKSL